MNIDTLYDSMLGAMADAYYGLAHKRAKQVLEWLDDGGFAPVRHTVKEAKNHAAYVLQRTKGYVECDC